MFNPRATRVRIERFYIHTHVHINVDIRDTNDGDKVRRSITYTHTAAFTSPLQTRPLSQPVVRSARRLVDGVITKRGHTAQSGLYSQMIYNDSMSQTAHLTE